MYLVETLVAFVITSIMFVSVIFYVWSWIYQDEERSEDDLEKE